jgi:hypothetical protein
VTARKVQNPGGSGMEVMAVPDATRRTPGAVASRRPTATARIEQLEAAVARLEAAHTAPDRLPEWLDAVDRLSRRLGALEEGRLAILDDDAIRSDIAEGIDDIHNRLMFFINDHAKLIDVHSRALDQIEGVLRLAGEVLIHGARSAGSQWLGINKPHTGTQGEP